LKVKEVSGRAGHPSRRQVIALRGARFRCGVWWFMLDHLLEEELWPAVAAPSRRRPNFSLQRPEGHIARLLQRGCRSSRFSSFVAVGFSAGCERSPPW